MVQNTTKKQVNLQGCGSPTRKERKGGSTAFVTTIYNPEAIISTQICTVAELKTWLKM